MYFCDWTVRTMSYFKPKKLVKGDIIGIISPASSPDDLTLIQNGVNYIEGLGYRTIVGNNVGQIRGYLAGTDDERVSDIHQMFRNKKVRAIFCLRGGYGAFRLLDKIDYELIKKNPKIFVGFSEITALQMAFLKKANLITFAGPMVIPNFSKNISLYTEEIFWRIVTSDKKFGMLNFSDLEQLPKIKPEKVFGRIVGGNLAVLTSLLGTGYLPVVKNKILFLEDISEPPYKIDRMLNQLRLNKVFNKVKGIVLGSFVDCEEKDKTKKTLSLEHILDDYFLNSDLPVIKSFPHGHIKDFVTIPFGIRININFRKGEIKFLESGVT